MQYLRPILLGSAVAVLAVILVWLLRTRPSAKRITTVEVSTQPTSAPTPSRVFPTQPPPIASISQTSVVSPSPAPKPTLAPDAQAWLSVAIQPAIAAASAEEARKLTLERYAGFLERYHLANEQRDRLLQLFDDRRQAILDVAIASYQNGIDPRDDFDGYLRRIADSRAIIDQEVRDLLGDSLSAQLQTYESEIERRAVFTRLNRQLTDPTVALSAEQTAQLDTLLKNQTRGHVSPEIIDSAATFLGPAQLAALRSAYVQQENVPRDRARATLPGGQ